MGYKKVQTVPSLMISFQSATLFQCLCAEEKEIVWNALIDYAESARNREAEEVEPTLCDGLSKLAYKVFEEMVNSITEGFEMYWKTCEKNSERIKRRWERQRNKADNCTKEDTTVYHGIPQYTETEYETESENKNITYIMSKPYKEQVMESDKRDRFLRILKLIKAYGIELDDDGVERIARRVKFDDVDEVEVEFCLNVCKKKNILTGKYLAGTIRQVVDGWDSGVI